MSRKSKALQTYFFTLTIVSQSLIPFFFFNAEQEWNDVNMRWNKSEYGGIEDIRMPPHKLWKPDVLMYNR